MPEGKVSCRTPNPERPGITNIPQWRFDLMQDAIREVLKEGEIAFADLPDAVRRRLSAEDLARVGSIGWNVTTVKLEMEVRGELARVPGVSPQRLRLAGG